MNAAPHNDRQQDEQRKGTNQTDSNIRVWVLGEEAAQVELHDATLAYFDLTLKRNSTTSVSRMICFVFSERKWP
jgi:hypothetical protein